MTSSGGRSPFTPSKSRRIAAVVCSAWMSTQA
jgi:hypothetical protein